MLRKISLTFLLAATLWVVAMTAFTKRLYQEIQGEKVTLQTKYGTLIGRRRVRDEDVGGITDTVDTFLGIPYAAPPIGNLRFMAPQPPKPWRNARDAGKHPPSCIQREPRDNLPEFVSEDCLTLNVHSPYQPGNTTTVYPVMLFIHGGSYTSGGAVLRPGGVLAQHGVVVVVINYRLGVLGFMTNGEPGFAGNYGLLDQIQALKWVRENIADFRGNPDQVTIFGNSAGGASVGLLNISPLAKGLFKYVIAQSGAPTAQWAVLRKNADVKKKTQDIAEACGCISNETEELLHCLRKVEPTFLTTFQNSEPHLTPVFVNYIPRVDGTVLPMFPEQAIRLGKVNADVYMTGVTSEELTRNLAAFIYIFRIDTSKGHQELNRLGEGLSRSTKNRLIDVVATHSMLMKNQTAHVLQYEYTDWSEPDDPLANRELASQFLSDQLMSAPAIDTANLLDTAGKQVYFYEFAHRLVSPPSSCGTTLNWHECRSHHVLEVGFVLGAIFDDMNVDGGLIHKYAEEDKNLSRKLMKIWSNFAKTGNPSLVETNWQPYSSRTRNFLFMDTNILTMKRNFKAKKMALWLDLVPQIEPNANYVLSSDGQTDRRTNDENGGDTRRVYVGVICVLAIVLMLCFVLLLICVYKNFRSKDGTFNDKMS